MAFIQALLYYFNMANVPVRERQSRRVLTSRYRIRHTLTFRTNITVIQHANFDLCTCDYFSLFVRVFRDDTMSILPIIPIVRGSFGRRFIIFTSVPIRNYQVTLTFADCVMLTCLMIISVCISFIIFLPGGLNVMKAQ